MKFNESYQRGETVKLINDVEQIKEVVANEPFVLGYFTTEDCNLCKDLFPKVEKMLEQFPKITGIKAEANQDQRIVGEYKVYTVPSIVLFIEGKETLRYARNVSIPELTEKIERYYNMFFE